MSKCKTVTLRKRKIKNGTQYSLCLDYYPGYRDNTTMKVITREALGIYIFAKPANQQERDFNARMMKKAEILRNRRYEAIFNENNGFFDKAKMKGDFLAYFKELADRKNIKWRHVYKHFERFVNGRCTFEEVDVDLCRKFMEYLLGAPQSIHTNQKLHINSAAGYWSAFRAVLHTAYRDRKIKENPNGFLDRIESIPTMREHLSQEELIRLAETPCEEEVLKRAFLFGCLTGLRKSDIKQLTCQQIQPYTNGKMFVTTRMQKTKQIVHNPINDEAYGLLGERCEGLIFDGFKDKMLQGPLKRWLLAAGITKKITFHCTRHSFGSLHVEMGTDMAVTGKEHLERNDFIIEKQKEVMKRLDATRQYREHQLEMANQKMQEAESITNSLVEKVHQKERQSKDLDRAISEKRSKLNREKGSELLNAAVGWATGRSKALKGEIEDLRHEISTHEETIGQLQGTIRTMQNSHHRELMKLKTEHQSELSRRDAVHSEETMKLKNRIAWQNLIIESLGFLLLKTSEIFRKAVHGIICLARDYYKPRFDTEQVADIKGALNLFGEDRQSHRAAGDFLYFTAKQKGGFDNREQIKAKREVDNVVEGNYDQQQKRGFSIRR